jgi:hypothetical protein
MANGQEQNDIFLFDRCEIPDLSKLDSNLLLRHAVLDLLIGNGPQDKMIADLFRNYLRLIDQLIFEYERTRALCLGIYPM